MNPKCVTVNIDLRINIELIKRQKHSLLNVINESDGVLKEDMEGILNILDSITDEISEEDYNPKEVFYLKDEPETQYENRYECEDCGEMWSDVWTSQSDDECPNCHAINSPYDSIEC